MIVSRCQDAIEEFRKIYVVNKQKGILAHNLLQRCCKTESCCRTGCSLPNDLEIYSWILRARTTSGPRPQFLHISDLLRSCAPPLLGWSVLWWGRETGGVSGPGDVLVGCFALQKIWFSSRAANPICSERNDKDDHFPFFQNSFIFRFCFGFKFPRIQQNPV